jgi:two-component SAPR family response regulator
VVLKLSENYNVDLNKIKLDVQQIAEDVMDEIANDDTHWDCEQDAFKRVIERYLSENGIEWRNE